jgi:hypothetical protein
MGDVSGSEISVVRTELESFSVETPGGRLHIRWDSEARATPNAQLAFFAEFLSTSGVYESWIDSCPLRYASSSGGDQHKPGRPSHALRTYYVGGLRLVLDVVVCPGRQHAAAYARPGLSDLLDNLPGNSYPLWCAATAVLATSRSLPNWRRRPAISVQAAPDQRGQEDAGSSISPQRLDDTRP